MQKTQPTKKKRKKKKEEDKQETNLKRHDNLDMVFLLCDL